MFGIGAGEFIMLAVVLLIAVGPKSMPKLMKAVGRGLREFQQAAQDLRSQVGIDEIMRDDELRDPLGLRRASSETPKREGSVTESDQSREYPAEGVDLRHARRLDEAEEGPQTGAANQRDVSTGDRETA